MSASVCRKGLEQGPGSALRGPAVGQEEQAGNYTQEVPPEHGEKLLPCAVAEP